MTQNKRKLLDDVYRSPGMEYLNRQKSHQFSYNVFSGNFAELKKVLSIIENPDLFNKIMCDKNRENMGNPVHMELNRHFHNFLAAAKTLTEHTRVFLREHYEDTKLKSDFNDKVKNEFSEDPLSRFIQDLRNYMLHKGLVGNSLSMTVKKIEGTEKFTSESTAYIKKNDLEKWDKWSKQGKIYLESQEDKIKISSFCILYGEKVSSLYSWFYKNLYDYHSEDYSELVKANNMINQNRKT